MGARVTAQAVRCPAWRRRCFSWLGLCHDSDEPRRTAALQELSTARASAADAEHQAEEAQKSTQARAASWAACFPCLAPPGASGVFVEPGGAGHRRDPAGGRGFRASFRASGLVSGEVERMSFAEAYQAMCQKWKVKGAAVGAAMGRLDRRMPSSPGLSSSPRSPRSGRGGGEKAESGEGKDGGERRSLGLFVSCEGARNRRRGRADLGAAGGGLRQASPSGGVRLRWPRPILLSGGQP